MLLGLDKVQAFVVASLISLAGKEEKWLECSTIAFISLLEVVACPVKALDLRVGITPGGIEVFWPSGADDGVVGQDDERERKGDSHNVGFCC